MAKSQDVVVSATEFQNAAGRFFDQAAKTPVFITRHRRIARVLLDIDEYERLAALDARQAITAAELSEAEIAALEAARMDRRHEHLDDLMD